MNLLSFDLLKRQFEQVWWNEHGTKPPQLSEDDCFVSDSQLMPGRKQWNLYIDDTTEIGWCVIDKSQRKC